MSRLPESQRYSIIWNDGPRVSALYKKLAEASLTSYVPGKGYNVWMAYGLILARGRGAGRGDARQRHHFLPPGHALAPLPADGAPETWVTSTAKVTTGGSRTGCTEG